MAIVKTRSPWLMLLPVPSSWWDWAKIAECGLAILWEENGGTSFQINGVEFFLPMTGEFNVRNAAMAVCVARKAGCLTKRFARAWLLLRGLSVARKFVAIERGVTVIDDFAHHPTAVEQVIDGLDRAIPVAA